MKKFLAGTLACVIIGVAIYFGFIHGSPRLVHPANGGSEFNVELVPNEYRGSVLDLDKSVQVNFTDEYGTKWSLSSDRVHFIHDRDANHIEYANITWLFGVPTVYMHQLKSKPPSQ